MLVEIAAYFFVRYNENMVERKHNREYHQRRDTLSLNGQLYLNYGCSLGREGLTPETRREFRALQLELLNKMSGIERTQLIDFISWKSNRLIGKKPKVRKGFEPLFPFEGY